MQHKQRKVCSKCLKSRPIEHFALHQSGGARCRKCYTAYFKAYNAQRYASHSARQTELERGRLKYRDQIKPRRLERKRRLLLLLGGQCSLCGYNKSAAALDFDHLSVATTCRGKPNPAKARTISHLLANNSPHSFDLALQEAKSCRILCSNCHREITYPGHDLAQSFPLSS